MITLEAIIIIIYKYTGGGHRAVHLRKCTAERMQGAEFKPLVPTYREEA